MQSKNPVLNRTHFGTPGTLDGPPLAMTLDSVVVRTAAIFTVLVGFAVPTFLLKPDFVVVLVAMLVGFGLGIFLTFSKQTRPALYMVYGAVEGVMVGGLSALYADAFGGNVVPQAVLGTLSAFAAMLFCYKAGLIRATEKFRSTLIMATVGYLLFSVVHFVGVMFGAWDSIYFGNGSSLMAVGLSAVGVVLASLYLILDFDMIEKAIAAQAPEQFAWRCAFSLVVTLVWLYLEILRLVSILSGRD